MNKTKLWVVNYPSWIVYCCLRRSYRHNDRYNHWNDYRNNDRHNHWEQVPGATIPNYSVSFDSLNGAPVSNISVSSNSPLSTPTAPTKLNHGFAGWVSDTNFTKAWNFSTDRVIRNITLYAIWLTNSDFVDNGNTITIKTYSGTMFNIVLPDTVNGKPVVSIASNAFKNKTGISNIVFPKSLTNIGNKVFYSCKGLTSVVLPEGMISIGSYAFFLCDSITNIVLPSCLSFIGFTAFYNSPKVRNINLPTDWTSIPSNNM